MGFCFRFYPMMVFLAVTMMAPRALYAAELQIPHLHSTVTLSKSSIVSGETVSLRFRFSSIADGLVTINVHNVVDIYSDEKEGMRLSIQDTDGAAMPSRTLRCQPASQRIIGQARLRSGEEVMLDYPLHLQVSTRLEPGHYTVAASGFDVVYGYMSPEYIESAGSGVKTIHTVRETFSVQALPLEIEPYDEARLVAAYEAIMRESRHAIEHPSGSWVGHDLLDIPAPVRSILWAYGPEAVPYQLELLFDDARGFRYWPPATVHTWDNIAQYATAEQVECLVDLASRLGVEKTPYAYSDKYAPGFIWAMHELHEHGVPSVRGLTGGLVEEFPKGDLCPHSMVIGVMPYGKG